MIQQLRNLETRLDCVMLGPPRPTTADQKRIWMSPDLSTMQFPAPVLDKWDPPEWIPHKDDGGFWLAQNVICYQRGYHQSALFKEFIRFAAMCFHHSEKECMENLIRLAFDFFIAVTDHRGTVVAGCVVEFRPSTDISQDPYLYISTVCTDPKFGGKGLAHQIVHAVYTLGMLMLEQNIKASGIWKNAIPTQHLYIGLTVRRSNTQEDKHLRLIHLYSQCGLTTQGHTPTAEYKSFTPYSIYEWQMDLDPTNLIPMWQNVSAGVLYEDKHIRILSPVRPNGVKMYHPLPETHTDSVRIKGIVHPKHACLHSPDTLLYVPESIQFTKTKPDGAFFCIDAEALDDSVTLFISVPYWFSSEIYSKLNSKQSHI